MVYRTTLTPLFTFRREMDRLFDDAFGTRRAGTVTWTPSMDVREEPSLWQFTVDLPGVPMERVDVSVENGLLSISGERSAIRTEDEEGRWHVAERVRGSFRRTFELPERVNPEGITASFDNGVLTVSVPKAEVAKTRKIPVTTAA